MWALCLTPLALLLHDAWAGDLGANPIDYMTRWLGVWTLRLLLASLTMTPLRILFRWSWPIAVRRLLGLFAFFYVCLHFAVWVVLDHFFDWGTMAADIVKRPFIAVGFAAVVLLVPLAATSNGRAVRRLGFVRWRRWHRLVYVSSVLGVIHFVWRVKADLREPLLFASALAVLLGIRVVDAVVRRTRRAAPA